jgi:hypothetical protein
MAGNVSTEYLSATAIQKWETGETDEISWEENGEIKYAHGTVPGGPNIGKPAFQFLLPLMKSITDGGTVIMETDNCISFIPAGFRNAKTVNTMNPVREEIGGTTALMSLVHVLTIPKNTRIYNATTLNESHIELLNEMKELGYQSVIKLMMSDKNLIGSLEWVIDQDGELEMNDGVKHSTKVIESDMSHKCRINFRKVLRKSLNGFNVSNTFHVGQAASIGWLHLHSFVTELRTSAYDTMERNAADKGYRKNTPFDEIMDSLTKMDEDDVGLERTVTVKNE